MIEKLNKIFILKLIITKQHKIIQNSEKKKKKKKLRNKEKAAGIIFEYEKTLFCCN